MLKETIHHLKEEERKSFFSGISKQLQEGGRFAVLTRPPRPQFPFFEAALDVFETGQERGEVFLEEMKSSGFKKVIHGSCIINRTDASSHPLLFMFGGAIAIDI